ncbi:hypothetical protein INT47_011748 [Mucor saturninus]|uniref:Retrotransposon gag domain-containing protein n=1 Tax=Mucor saturninus TaxID=64648 RepID=A0A8H7QE77_9FUNG|nr:hypothetical protein INT47_011748 [Mucor saturninus]
MSDYIANASITSSNESIQTDISDVHQHIGEDQVMGEIIDITEEPVAIDTMAIGADLDKRRKNASADLMKVLANPSTSPEEVALAQAAVDNTMVRWKAFLSAQEVLADASAAEVLEKIHKKKEGRDHANKLDSFVPPNLPAFQLQGGPIRQPSKMVHESIRSFLNEFEVQLRAHNLTFDKHWERLFWLTCDKSQRISFQYTKAGKGYTWGEFRRQMEQEHGNPYHLWMKRQEMRALTQGPREQIRGYASKYQEAAHAAALPNGEELVWLFVTLLTKTVREKAWQTIAQHFGLTTPKDINQVIPLVIATCGEENEVRPQEERWATGSKRRQEDHHHHHEDQDSFKKGKVSPQVGRATTNGSCPVHPKGRHSLQECQVLRNLVPKENKFSTPVSASRAPTLCRFCHKAPYVPGHKCQEYHLAKNKTPVFANRSARMAHVNEPANDNIDVDLSQLNLQAQGKKHLSHNNSDNNNDNKPPSSIDGSLYVPILVQSRRVWALPPKAV